MSIHPEKNSSILFLLTCLISLLSAVHTSAQKIFWSADRPLTWDDFNGKKPQKSRFSAVTYSGVHYSFHPNNGDSVQMQVTCSFDTKKSWKKNNRLKPELLKHEQVHFDISELYARKIRKSLSYYKPEYKYRDYYRWKLKVIFKHNVHRRNRMQRRYDRLTNHSKRKNIQEQWNQKIADELNELGAYESK